MSLYWGGGGVLLQNFIKPSGPSGDGGREWGVIDPVLTLHISACVQ